MGQTRLLQRSTVQGERWHVSLWQYRWSTLGNQKKWVLGGTEKEQKRKNEETHKSRVQCCGPAVEGSHHFLGSQTGPSTPT